MDRFHLERVVDKTGVSGTGRVAEGVRFSDGSAVVRWRGEHATTTAHASLKSVRAVHCHEGTALVWDEPCCLNCKHPMAWHVDEGCSGCIASIVDHEGPGGACVCGEGQPEGHKLIPPPLSAYGVWPGSKDDVGAKP